jgi:hypothetical protein
MIPQTITLDCGCTGIWNPMQRQYNAYHLPSCDQKRLRMEQRKALQQSHDESRERQDAPLARKPFSIWR